jgi:hypothetical protein
VLQLIVFLIAFGAIGVAYVRLQGGNTRTTSGLTLPMRLRRLIEPMSDFDSEQEDEPRRAALTMSLFRSIANPTRARASDNAIHITPGAYVAVGSPRDAAVIHASPEFFNQDINKLIELNRAPLRLRISAPIHIHHVIQDEAVADGSPYLLTDAEARQRNRRDPQPDGYMTPKASASPRGQAKGARGSQAGPIAGTLVPSSAKLRPITVTAPGQSFGRNPDHGPGQIGVETVSWDHARIVMAEAQDAWELSDVKSRHGTIVNDRDIRQDGHSHVLVDGDTIHFGPDARYTWSAYTTGYTRTG